MRLESNERNKYHSLLSLKDDPKPDPKPPNSEPQPNNPIHEKPLIMYIRNRFYSGKKSLNI